MILVIDNYDSFTFNLVQYLGELGAKLKIFRNNRITIDEIIDLAPDRIVISPGPCTPNEAGISVDVAKTFTGKVPILGVCLGHQSLGQAFGGKVIKAPKLFHGKVSEIHHDNRTIFKGLPQPFIATRYHSLIIDEKSIPDCLEVSARTSDGVIMGLRHRQFPSEGVQFHPESILTKDGKSILSNFLNL